MSRGTVPGLASAHPLGDLLPGVYLEDPMARGLTAGLDPLLAPVFLTLDCLHAYLDPTLTPPDFLPWLASWLGVELDETMPEDRQRALVAAAGRLHHRHGTAAGLTEYLELLTGATVELQESGGTVWAAVAGADPPGSPTPGLTVTVRVPDPSRVDLDRLRQAVHALRPAHLPYEVVLEQLPAPRSRAHRGLRPPDPSAG